MTGARPSNDSRCAVCGRASAGELCRYHGEAAKRLTEHRKVWEARTGASWEDYLRAVSSSELAGEWVRETATHLLGKAVTEKRDQTA